MKRVMKHLSWALCTTIIFVWMSCEKEASSLPPREVSPEVAEIVEKYTDVLMQSPQGWILAYRPDQYGETIYFHLTFKEGAKVDVLAGYRGYHTPQTDIAYYYEGKYTPIIAFDGANVFSELADLYNGTYKFKIYFNESEGTFAAVRADGFDDKRFELVPANEDNLALLQTQIDEILAQIAYEEEQQRLTAEVRQKIKEFVEIESDFYFYNLTVGDFSAAINSFDTVSRQIGLTYKATPTSEPATITVSYEVQAEGLALNPALSNGTESIALLGLGELLYEDPDAPNKATAIEITANSQAGTMGYAHVAPYPYTLIGDRTVSTVDWLLAPAQQNAGLFLYTADADSHYSTWVNADRTAFKSYINAEVNDALATNRLVNQIYFPANQASSRNIQISTQNGSASGNRFFLYNIDISKMTEGSSALKITLTTAASTITPYIDAFNDYLNPQFPAEGVTVAPVIVGTTLRLRLISRKDSRYWVEYVLNRAADRSNRFD